MSGQHDHLAYRQAVRLAGDDDLGLAFQHVNQRIERRGVLAQTLPLVECEHRDGPCRPFQEGAAHDGALLIGDEVQRTHLFGNLTQRQLALARSSGRLSLDLAPAPDRPALMRALHPDPNQRFRSCTDFVRALHAAGSPSPLSDHEGDVRIGQRPESVVDEEGWVLLGAMVGLSEELRFDPCDPQMLSYCAYRNHRRRRTP